MERRFCVIVCVYYRHNVHFGTILILNKHYICDDTYLKKVRVYKSSPERMSDDTDDYRNGISVDNLI